MTHFLIVDDDALKAKSIIAVLVENGVGNVDIETAENAAEARIKLQNRFFDVMLLDVLLPSRMGAQPRGENSVDFLKEIIEDHTTRAPGQILATTADLSAMAQHESEFRDLTTQILHVSPTEDGWRQSLGKLVHHLRARATEVEAYNIDVCFQTALRSPELDALLKYLPIEWEDEELLSPGIFYRKGRGVLGSKQVSFVSAHASQMGMVAATHLSDALITSFRPKVLAMTGICGGLNAELCVGDVVVADKSWDWQSGKWDDAGNFHTSLDPKEACSSLVGFTRSIEKQIMEFYTEYDAEKPSQLPKLHVGPMTSGSAVVADPSFHDIFKAQHRKVSAVDMECYGVYYAAAMSKSPSPRVICIKAISDMANKDKSDNFQKYCSYLSAKVMFATLERYFNM